MPKQQTMPAKQKVLIIDDAPSIIKILNETLKEYYIITVATNGESALSHLKPDNLPDIILLDIMMPGMNGYEVCQQLKSKKETSEIPVIFITSKNEIGDEELGFKMDAVDYIVKPISPPIVKARIKTHLLIKHQRDLLQNSISILHHKTEILQHKAELGMLAAGLAHDINNILFVAMMIENLPYMISDDMTCIEQKDIIEKQVKSIMESLAMGRDICRGFTNYLNDLGEQEKIQLFPPLLKPLDMFEKTFKIKLYKEISSNLPYIKCKGSQIKRAIINLFINACQAIEGQEIKQINIRVWSGTGHIFFSIQDNGPGIPDHVLPHIFEEHYTTRKEGNGLGLSMVQRILNSHNGAITCSTISGKGTTFTLSLPEFNAPKCSVTSQNIA